MKDIEDRIKSLRIKKNELIKEHYKIISGIETKIKKLKKDLQKVCPHTDTKIEDRDYFEAGRMAKPVVWKEKVCKECGKVLGTSEETTTWSKFK